MDFNIEFDEMIYTHNFLQFKGLYFGHGFPPPPVDEVIISPWYKSMV